MIRISITGLDGCGKSTQSKLLSEKLSDSRIVSVWDLLKRKEFKKWTIYQPQPKVENYVYHLHPFSRSLFIFHSFNEAYQKAVQSEAEFLIFDGDWYKYWAIEQAMGSWNKFGELLNSIYPTADLTFYLKMSIPDLIKRKKKISVYEGGNDNKTQKFIEIQTRAKTILESYLPKDTVVLDGCNHIEEIHRDIVSFVNRIINK